MEKFIDIGSRKIDVSRDLIVLNDKDFLDFTNLVHPEGKNFNKCRTGYVKDLGSSIGRKAIVRASSNSNTKRHELGHLLLGHTTFSTLKEMVLGELEASEYSAKTGDKTLTTRALQHIFRNIAFSTWKSGNLIADTIIDSMKLLDIPNPESDWKDLRDKLLKTRILPRKKR